jgi:hypothetical protein
MHRRLCFLDSSLDSRFANRMPGPFPPPGSNLMIEGTMAMFQIDNRSSTASWGNKVNSVSGTEEVDLKSIGDREVEIT